MNSRGFGVVGTLVTIAALLAAGVVGWRLAGPHLRKAGMETALSEVLDKEFRAGDDELVAAIVEAGSRIGLSIPGDAVEVMHEGKKVTVRVKLADEADLLVVKIPSTSTIEASREVSWARGVVDNAQDRIDRAVRQQEDRFSNVPSD